MTKEAHRNLLHNETEIYFRLLWSALTFPIWGFIYKVACTLHAILWIEIGGEREEKMLEEMRMDGEQITMTFSSLRIRLPCLHFLFAIPLNKTCPHHTHTRPLPPSPSQWRAPSALEDENQVTLILLFLSPQIQLSGKVLSSTSINCPQSDPPQLQGHGCPNHQIKHKTPSDIGISQIR